MLAPIYREWSVVSCMIVQSITMGFTVAFPAILTPVITSDGSDIRVTKEEASWITAANGMTGPLGLMIMPYVMQTFGRRITNICVNVFELVGCITIALAPNYAGLIAGRALLGIVFFQTSVSSLTIAEYSHPKRRGISIIMYVVFIHIGITLCHGLSAKLSWREISWLSTVPNAIGLVATLIWPESPSWLAYKGRYQDCENAFQWLRGDNHESRKELRELIMAQKELKHLEDSSNSVQKTLRAFRSKEFLKPLLITMTLHCLLQASGSLYLMGYLIEIITGWTKDKSLALYFTVAVDLLKLLASVILTSIVGRFNRRTLVSLAGLLCFFVLGLVSLSDYLNQIKILSLPWLPASLLLFYGFAFSSLYCVLITVSGEIFPIQYKGIGIATSGVFASLTGALTLKLTSNMLSTLQTYGTFTVYLIIIVGCLTLLYFILPETKDRTLQNIENEIVNLKLSDKEETGKEMVSIMK